MTEWQVKGREEEKEKKSPVPRQLKKLRDYCTAGEKNYQHYTPSREWYFRRVSELLYVFATN